MSHANRGASIRHRTTKAGSAWQVRWREQGVLNSKSFRTSREANKFARQASVIKQAHSVVAASMPAPVKMADLVPSYVELVRARNKAGSSHPDQVSDLLRLAEKRMAITWVHEIDTSALDRLVQCYGSHRSTLKKSISTLKTFLRWVRLSRLRIDEWVLGYRPPRHIPEERLAWNDEQVRRLLAVCDAPNSKEELPSGKGFGQGSEAMVAQMIATRDFLKRESVRPALWLMLRYGPRPIESARMVVSNWDASSRTLSLPAAITKNGHPRSFLVDEDTARVLTEAAGDRGPREPLFRNHRKTAWTSHHLTDVVNELVQRAGIPGTAYCCRHTACTRLIAIAKGDLPLVQSITGHRTLSELQKYMHSTSDRRSAVADAYNRAAEEVTPVMGKMRLVK